MGEKDQKTPPTEHEVKAFYSVANATNLMILRVQFNGDLRFAMGILHEDSQGAKFIQVVGILPRADDRILTPGGEPAVTMPPDDKNNMN